jgi:hypothetical protein
VYKRKEFTHKHVDFPELETVSINGKRYYVTTGGETYPSVTTVLDSMTDKSSLFEWRKRIGEAEANKISRRAANRGTALHLTCEKYLLGEEINFEEEMPTTNALFAQAKEELDSKVDNIYCIEKPLVSNKLKVAGRVDLIAEYEDDIAVIDFKTSDKTKRKDWIENYFLQASLYSYMFWEMTGIPVKKIVIAICVESETKPQIFIESPVSYIEKSAGLVRAFHKSKN